MASRFGYPTTSFSNYIKINPTDSGPTMAPAALVTDENVEYVRKYWQLPHIQVGEYLLLLGNGNGMVMSADVFKRTYTRAHTTA